MPIITAQPGTPEEIEEHALSCSPTRVIVTVCNAGTEDRAGGTGVRLTLLADGPSAEGTTDAHGVVTFTITDLDQGSAELTLTSTNPKRPAKACQRSVTRGEYHAVPLELGSHIAAIDILHGDDVAGEGDLIQFVNLPAEEAWLARTKVPNLDRLSTCIRVRVRFHYPCVEPFTVKMAASGDNAVYTAHERERNARYKPVPEDPESGVKSTSDDKGMATLPDAFRVTAAGGDRYRFEAVDSYGNGVRTENAAIVTRRLFFLQPLLMTGLTNQPTRELSVLTEEYRKHHVELVILEPVDMAYISNVGLSNMNDFKDKAREACPESEYTPYVIFVAFAEQLAERGDGLLFRSNHTARPGMPDYPILGLGTLWTGFGDGIPWLLDATFTPDAPRDEDLENDAEELRLAFDEYDEKRETFDLELSELNQERALLQEDANGVTEESEDFAALKDRKAELDEKQRLLDERNEELDAEEDDLDQRQEELDARRQVTALEPIDLTDYCIAVNKEGGTDVGPFKRIVIKLGDAVEEEMTGTLRVSYQKIGYQRGGLSIPKTNLCAVATRINGKPKDAAEQNQILIHEIGHQIGMVPSHDPQGNVGPRSAAELDRHANQYEGRGHNGSHCCNGLDAMAQDYQKVKVGALCVMFGSVHAPTTFCVDCASAVRRKDLSAGFTFV